VAGTKNFFGFTSADFKLSKITEDVFLDFKGTGVFTLKINGASVELKDFPNLFDAHKIKLPAKYLTVG